MKHEVEEEIRKTGIAVIGDVPWGTHFCCFYQAKEDLIDVLVPYFKAGLENNEFCMWVTSGPLSEEEAKEAMRKAVPSFDRYLKRGQMEIVPYDEWYLKDGAFNLQRVLNAWVDKLDQALAEGYDGIRVTGNTAWLEKNGWRSFVDYEKEVNNVIGEYQMMAICTYSLDKCGASEVIDVVRNHQFALIKRRGEWELIESSELKRAKESLRESEEKYRDLLENARDAIMALDLNGNITFVNRVVEEYGFKRDEVIGKSMVEFVSEKYLPRLIKEFANVIQGNPAEGEIELITPKGKIVSEYRSSPIKRGNKVIGSQTILRDITERKKAKEALRESEEKFRNIFESANDAMIFFDRFGRILDVNRKAVEVFGGSKKELLGKHFAKVGVVSPRDIPRLMRAFAKGLAGKHPTLNICIKNKKGQEIFLECLGSLMKVDGKIVGGMVVARDVTERKKMEEKLRQYSENLEAMVEKRTKALVESEKRYSTLVEHAHDGIVISIPDRIVFANKRLQEITGYSGEELLQITFDKLLTPESIRELSERRKAAAKGKPVPNLWQLKIRSKQGHILTVETTFTPVTIEGQSANLVIVRDITERKKMEEQLLEAEKLAAIGELATMVGHDLRNPLQAIENAAYYLNNELPRLLPSILTSQKAVEMLQIINNSVNYADRIIKDLHEFSTTKNPPSRRPTSTP